jgi:hypothetical protein
VIAAISIIGVWLVVIGVVVYFGLLRRRLAPEPSTVTLQYRSGTTVTLEATEVERAHPAPAMRRKLPGLMPTAGHAVVPRKRPSGLRPVEMSWDET